MVPWPISDRTTRMTTLSSGLMTTQALTSGVAPCASAALDPPTGILSPSARPPPAAAAAPTTKERRLSCGICVMASSPSRAGSRVDGRAHLLEGAAAADVGDGVVDVGVGGLGLVLQERCHRHDHAGLAVAALGHVVIDPGLLHLVQRAARGEPLDGGNLLALGGADWQRAGAHRRAVDVHGAGAALGDAAAIFGSSQTDILPDRPQQWRIGCDVDLVALSVDGQPCHGVLLLCGTPALHAMQLMRAAKRRRTSLRTMKGGLEARIHSNVRRALGNGGPRACHPPAETFAHPLRKRSRTLCGNVRADMLIYSVCRYPVGVLYAIVPATNQR